MLDPARRRLTRSSGESVVITAKAFDALICLIEHAGEVVSRATLSKTPWPNTVVEDNNLS
jgi:DNA-binding winged helix-turn-helix (wHTH) protein